MQYVPPVVIVAVLCVFVWALFGRLVAAHTQEESARGFSFNLAVCAASGLGAYTLWWLLFVPMLGANTSISAGLFALCTLAMSGAMFRTWGRARDEHFATLAMLQAVIAAPLVWSLLGGVNVGEHDWLILQQLNQFKQFDVWPTAEQFVRYGFPAPDMPLGWLAALNPLAWSDTFHAAPVLNVMFIIMAVGGVAVASGITVRWSNVLLVAAGTLPAAAWLNPQLPMLGLAQATPELAVSMALLAAALPLMSGYALPTGIGALPPALALAWLATLSPLGLVWAGGIVVLWLVRGVVEHGPDGKNIFALSLLSSLPVMAWLLEQKALAPLGYGQLAALHNPGVLLNTLPQAFIAPPPMVQQMLLLAWVTAILLGLFSLVSRWQQVGGIRGILTISAWLSVPAFLAGLALIVVALAGRPEVIWPTLASLQWVLLVPVWRWWMVWYSGSSMRVRFFHSPWMYGGILAVAGMLVMQAAQPFAFQGIAPLASHALAVGATIQEKNLVKFTEPVAVVGGGAAATGALSYALAGRAPVAEVQGEWDSLADLHRQLRGKGFNYIWLAQPPEAQANRFGLNANMPETFLFRLQGDGLVLTATFPAAELATLQAVAKPAR